MIWLHVLQSGGTNPEIVCWNLLDFQIPMMLWNVGYKWHIHWQRIPLSKFSCIMETAVMKILCLIDNTVLCRDKKNIIVFKKSPAKKRQLVQLTKAQMSFLSIDRLIFLDIFFLPIFHKGCASQSCSREFTVQKWNRSYKRVFSSVVLFISFYSVQNFGVELKFPSIVPLESACLQQSVSFSSTEKCKNVTWK